MKVLIYKRTHRGDPNQNGVFGNQDCMGRVRNWDYDAVIGVGGKRPWIGHEEIKYKINWIGLSPKKIESKIKRGANIVFSHFELYEEKGENIKIKYPKLFKYMYGSRKRFDMSSKMPEDVFIEVKKIIDSIKDSPKSKSYSTITSECLESKIKFKSHLCLGCYNGEELEVTFQEC